MIILKLQICSGLPPNGLERIIFYSNHLLSRSFFIMKLLCFALCVLLFVPGLTLAADDGAWPSRPAPPMSRMSRREVILEKIAQLQASIKSRKEKMAEALAISTNPKSGKGAVENADDL